jgi:bisanhydrobacterioruberin hydratase
MSYLNKVNAAKFFIVLFHLVGLTGFLSPNLSKLFLIFVPFHLLLMLILLLINQKKFTKNFWFAVVFIFFAGIFVEIIGVATGMIFGIYTYGETLGYKIINVPIIIGVNWLILIVAIGAVLTKFMQLNNNFKSVFGALILTLMDVLIEPVAIKYDYWHWQNNLIPFQNYVGWFIVSFLFLKVYHQIDFNKSNKVAGLLLITQALFFIILNLTVV